jgi:hypothetical protein
VTGDSANIKSDSGLGGGAQPALAAQYLIAKETRLGEDR